VIAILIGLLLPAMSRARASAMSVQCTSNLRQWATATMMYANQERGWLPRRGQGVQVTTVIDRPSDWFNALPPMLRMKPFTQLVAENQIPRPGESTIWMCPAAIDAGQKYFFAYAMNMRLSTWNAPTPRTPLRGRVPCMSDNGAVNAAGLSLRPPGTVGYLR